MKKILFLVLVITLFFSCEEKSKLSYVVAEKILSDESDPYRYKHAHDVIMNASRDEYNKHRSEMNDMLDRIEAEYTQIEKEAFLAKYGKTKVAFTEKSCYLFIMNLDGTEKEQLTSFSFDGEDLFLKFIRWSPDGKYIVCNHALRNSNLMLINVETKEISWLTETNNDSWPNWSPDSKNVIFFRDDNLSVISIDIETKKETILYHDWEYPALFPFYLPNGEDIAFNRNLQLQVLRKGESIPEPLIGTRSAKDEITLGGVLSVGSYENGCTSNNGKYILTNGISPDIFDLEGNLVEQKYGTYGTWSYDDEYIMYDTSDGHGNQAYAVTPLFEDPQKITTVIFLGLGGKAAWCPLPPGE